MFAKLSESGSWFWVAFTIFLILIAIIWWGIANRCGNGRGGCGGRKAREVLSNWRITMLIIFNVFAIGGFISAAPCWHWVIAIIIYIIIAAIIFCLWRNGGCNWRRRWNNDSCESNNSNSCESNNNSNDCGDRRRCGNRHEWRILAFAFFWAIVGAIVGTLARHLQHTCLIGAIKILNWYWWACAILAVLLFGLLWQVAGTWAKCRARRVLLSKYTWVVLYFFIGLWLGALSGASWVYGLLLILVWVIIRFGLRSTWSYFCTSNWYVWATSVAFFIGFILGVYVLRYLQLADGAYFAKCSPMAGFKSRIL